MARKKEEVIIINNYYVKQNNKNKSFAFCNSLNHVFVFSFACVCHM